MRERYILVTHGCLGLLSFVTDSCCMLYRKEMAELFSLPFFDDQFLIERVFKNHFSENFRAHSYQTKFFKASIFSLTILVKRITNKILFW